MRERDVETYLKWVVEREGGAAYKFASPSQRGVADRIVCLPDGQTWFIELKNETGRLSPLQVHFGEEMIRLNQNYACLCSMEEVDRWVYKALGVTP